MKLRFLLAIALSLAAANLATSQAEPGPYQLNPHTLFYVPFDSKYVSNGSTVFPELARNPLTPDRNDCLVVQSGNFFRLFPKKFGNALHVNGYLKW